MRARRQLTNDDGSIAPNSTIPMSPSNRRRSQRFRRVAVRTARPARLRQACKCPDIRHGKRVLTEGRRICPLGVARAVRLFAEEPLAGICRLAERRGRFVDGQRTGSLDGAIRRARVGIRKVGGKVVAHCGNQNQFGHDVRAYAIAMPDVVRSKLLTCVYQSTRNSGSQTFERGADRCEGGRGRVPGMERRRDGR